MSGPKKAATGGWLSGALANLESRLDTILADDAEASAKQRVAEQEAQANTQRLDSSKLAAPSGNTSASGSRSTSRSRVNDRLAERLAKATAQKPPSRVSTPVNDAISARTSGETDRHTDTARSVPNIEVDDETGETTTKLESETVQENGVEHTEAGATRIPDSLSSSKLPINPTRISSDSSRPSADLPREDASPRPSLDAASEANHSARSATELQAEVDQMQTDYAKAETQRQEEMHAYLERIDALQAKLTYLAKETVAAAKEANAAAATGSPEKQLAEKDEKIALLMEEGEKLSRSEMQRMQTIKKLRNQATEDEKATAQLRKRVDSVERSEADLKAKLRKAQTAERQAVEKTKQIAAIEKQVEELRVDRENAADLVRNLTRQLKEAKDQAAKAENEIRVSEVNKGKIADLQNELEDAQIEKKLAEDRAAADIKKAKEESQQQVERFAVRELELKNEISSLETRLEALRTRAEEASSMGAGEGGESSIKLMRQVETLQQQYNLARSNWETIEGSLNARLATLEQERDEVTRREAELRKKNRDVTTKARKTEDQLESTLDRLSALEAEYKTQQQSNDTLHAKLEQSESLQADIKAELDRQRKLWESEHTQRLEEEKAKWRKELLSSTPQLVGSPRAESLATFARKSSGFDITHRRPMMRLASHDVISNHTEQRPGSRRSSALPSSSRAFGSPSAEPSPSLSRQESDLSFEGNHMPPTPSVEVDARISEVGDYDDGASPQRTINDLMSTSTAGPAAGPSVQLVERMSSLVRKLESEKASFKDELNRLSAQRDDARNEVVELMREVEAKRTGEKKVAALEKEMSVLKGRYDASLEMLGEREEEVDELKGDVVELKRIYRELVETKIGGSA